MVLATTANSVEDLTTKFRAMNEARREQEVRGAANILEFGPAQKASYEALEKAQETELKNLRQRKAELENLIPVLEKEAKAARDRAVLLNGNRNAEGEYARTLGALRSAQRELSSTNEDGIAKARSWPRPSPSWRTLTPRSETPPRSCPRIRRFRGRWRGRQRTSCTNKPKHSTAWRVKLQSSLARGRCLSTFWLRG